MMISNKFANDSNWKIFKKLYSLLAGVGVIIAIPNFYTYFDDPNALKLTLSIVGFIALSSFIVLQIIMLKKARNVMRGKDNSIRFNSRHAKLSTQIIVNLIFVIIIGLLIGYKPDISSELITSIFSIAVIVLTQVILIIKYKKAYLS